MTSITFFSCNLPCGHRWHFNNLLLLIPYFLCPQQASQPTVVFAWWDDPIFISEGSGLLAVLPKLGCCSFPLTNDRT